jgi:hypothetical protein
LHGIVVTAAIVVPCVVLQLLPSRHTFGVVVAIVMLYMVSWVLSLGCVMSSQSPCHVQSCGAVVAVKVIWCRGHVVALCGVAIMVAVMLRAASAMVIITVALSSWYVTAASV